MGKKRRDGRASKRGDNSAASNAAVARNSRGGGLQHSPVHGGVQQFALRYLGGIYKGGIKHGKPHGKGKIEWEDGEFYDGEWRDGKAHGEAMNVLANGCVYEGEFEHDRHGWGIMKWPSGQVYEGEWVRGKQHGRGTMTSANGDVFAGQWRDNERHGRGTMKYTSGEVYVGEWEDGEEHGKGTLKFPTGEICEGIWVHGELANRGGIDIGGNPSLPNADTGNNGTAQTANREHLNGRKLRSHRSQQWRLEADKKACEHCGVDDFQYKLRVCSGCNLALYCSATCQKAARRSHQRICDIISQLPPRDADRLVLTFSLQYDKEKMVDLDAGMRYGTKYMANLKHLKIDLKMLEGGDVAKLSAKRLSSLLKSKRGDLDSFVWETNAYSAAAYLSQHGNNVLKELHGLKQLRLDCMRFDGVQPVCDIIGQQQDTLEVLCLPWLRMSWSRAKSRRALAQAIGACRHLVKLDLAECLLLDSDLKVMLQDLPNLRILHLERNTVHAHGFTDNTCGLIARKCPGLQELKVYNHNQLSARGVRKIFEGCPHLRSFSTSTHKLSCMDVQSLLDIAPQLMYLCLGYEVGFSAGEVNELIEATGGRTVLRFGLGFDDAVYVPKEEGVPAETRETYDRTKDALDKIWGRWNDPEVANEWAGIFEG
ncbi:hypothetical protein ACHAXT_011395 [Thalassiosira profunda]